MRRMVCCAVFSFAMLTNDSGSAASQSITLVQPPVPAKPAPSLDAQARQLRRDAQVLQQASSAFEAAVAQKQAEYASRELQHTVDALKKIPDILKNPSATPSNWDLFKLAKAEMERVLGTVAGLVELQTQLNEIVAKEFEQARKQKAFEQAQRRAINNGTSQPLTTPLPPLPPSLQKKTTADLDDDIDLWCWETKGDRCFDGKPREFAAFLKRHPEAKQHSEAVVSAPTVNRPQPTANQACQAEYNLRYKKLEACHAASSACLTQCTTTWRDRDNLFSSGQIACNNTCLENFSCNPERAAWEAMSGKCNW